jgi:hypothetical protein
LPFRRDKLRKHCAVTLVMGEQGQSRVGGVGLAPQEGLEARRFEAPPNGTQAIRPFRMTARTLMLQTDGMGEIKCRHAYQNMRNEGGALSAAKM